MRSQGTKGNGLRWGLCVLLSMCLLTQTPVLGAKARQEEVLVGRLYREYLERLEGIQRREDLKDAGFFALEEQIFTVELQNLGEVEFLPALDEAYGRLVLFFADSRGEILYRTENLASNYLRRGEIAQPNEGLAAVSFQDVNGDGYNDIILIALCDEGKQKRQRVGEVLFAGKEGFYRDWRISDNINQYGMNKSVDLICAYVRDGKSTEFLYEASTREELLQHGFTVISEQYYSREFEKFGKLWVMPGTFRIGSYEIFMIYLIDGQGNIVWSFQPMGEYDSLYALKGIHCRDIDGDGMKDIIVLGRYSTEVGGQRSVISDYEIYYQRTGNFVADEEFKKRYRCSDGDTVEELVKKARGYWGWSLEE